LEVLPWTLCYCVWFGQSFVAVNYLLCAEHVRLSTGALAAGLVANVLFNLALLPLLGLLGAVLATSAGKWLVLVLVLCFSRMLGMKVHTGTWVLAFLPLTLAAGATVATLALLITVAAALCSDRVFRAREKQLFVEMLSQLRKRLQTRSSAEASAG
jgi:peptidoglycan biosynthesis protein MviN/MurJ (putative lipid II flippase)